MAPVGFGNIQKTAKDILDDDYQTSGYEFQAKNATTWNGAVATTNVNIFPKDSVQTPAKIGWKFPSPFGIKGLSVDKLEMDKAGKFKLETSASCCCHGVQGLKVEAKSDLTSLQTITGALIFTGIPDTQVKLDTTMMKPDTFMLDITRSVQQATFGVKFGKANMKAPDLGVRFLSGPLFASLLVTNKFKTYACHAAYTVSNELNVAATVTESKGKDIKGVVGLEYKVSADTKLKAKVDASTDETMSVSASVKHNLEKGFTVATGGKYENKGGITFGLKLSVE